MKKDLEVKPSPPNRSKDFRNISLAYIYQLTKFGGLTSCGSKDSFKNAPCAMH